MKLKNRRKVDRPLAAFVDPCGFGAGDPIVDRKPNGTPILFHPAVPLEGAAVRTLETVQLAWSEPIRSSQRIRPGHSVEPS